MEVFRLVLLQLGQAIQASMFRWYKARREDYDVPVKKEQRYVAEGQDLEMRTAPQEARLFYISLALTLSTAEVFHQMQGDTWGAILLFVVAKGITLSYRRS